MEFLGDVLVSLRRVREKAFAAVFDVLFVLEITAALVPQRIQRAEAEQTVKVVRVCSFVTWEILAGRVGESFEVFSIQVFEFHIQCTSLLSWIDCTIGPVEVQVWMYRCGTSIKMEFIFLK